jgi:hypothetical protein
MAAPVSISEIVAGIRLCQQLYDICIAPANNASVLCAEFKSEIKNFEERLKDFRRAFEHVETAVFDVDDDFDNLEPLSETIRKEARELVGDFGQTLQDCVKLLEKHTKLGTRRANALDNISWHNATQPDVDILRKRLHEHKYKILLFMEPLQLELIADIWVNTSEILELLRRHFGLVEYVELPKIPPAIHNRLLENLNKNAPTNIPDPSAIPLKQGVDVLIAHWRQCSSIRSTTGDNTVAQYFNLVKTQWMMEAVSQSRELKTSRQGHLFRRIVGQIEQKIAIQHARPNITRYTEDVLLQLHDSCFVIWPKQPKPESIPSPLELQEELVRVELVSESPNVKKEVQVFKVDDQNLRVVHLESREDQPEPITSTRFPILNQDTFVPLYTIAPSNTIEIGYNGGNRSATVAYTLRKTKDALALQSAFVGYVPFHHSIDVDVVVTTKSTSKWNPLAQVVKHEGRGAVQIWRWPSPDSHQLTSPSISRTTTLTDDGTTTIGSPSSRTTRSRLVQGINTSAVSISQNDKKDSRIKEVAIANTLPPPLLVAFVKNKNEYRMWQIDGTFRRPFPLPPLYFIPALRKKPTHSDSTPNHAQYPSS